MVSKELKSKIFHNNAKKIFAAQARNKRVVCKAADNKKKESTGSIGLSTENRNKFIRKYVHLVNWVVGRLPVASLKGMDRDDLVGFGTIGLIEAVDRFDSARNSSFESFAITRIRGAIYDQLRASDWLTRGSRKKVKNLHKIVSELENKLSRYPSNKEVAEELKISEGELREIQREAQIGIFSLDEPKDLGYEDNIFVIDSISSNDIPHLETLEDTELKERLVKAIEMLPEREKTVVGLYHYKRLTFKEIADVMDFSESRASQIHARAISLLKSKLLKD